MEYVLTCDEVKDYNENGEISERLASFWEDFLSKLSEKFRKEAVKKGFQISEHPLEAQTPKRGFSHNFMFDIPKASKELKKMTEEFDNILICMEDPI